MRTSGQTIPMMNSALDMIRMSLTRLEDMARAGTTRMNMDRVGNIAPAVAVSMGAPVIVLKFVALMIRTSTKTTECRSALTSWPDPEGRFTEIFKLVVRLLFC